MIKRGLTLLETLIALVLLLALGALILPAMMDSLDERTFESAADVTNEQLMMARAHAQATGSPVEVTYKANTSEVQVRLFTPWLAGFQSSSTQDSAYGETSPVGPVAPQENEGSTATTGVIEQSWACRALGRGMHMSSRPPASSDSQSAMQDEQTNGRGDDRESWNDLGKGQDIRLAVFMPDGSALLGDPVWLNDDKGRCGLLSINPWSGLPLFQRLANNGDGLARTGAPKDPTRIAGDDGRDEPAKVESSKAAAASDRSRRSHARNSGPVSVPEDDTIGSQ